MVKIKINDITAEINNFGISCIDEFLLGMLKAQTSFFELETDGYALDRDFALAKYLLGKFGGKIIHYEPPIYTPIPNDAVY